jgi:hypothetical protein
VSEDAPGPVVRVNFRQKAIDDGVLFDLSPFEVSRTNWKMDIACSFAVMRILSVAVGADGKDLQTILEDIYSRAKATIRTRDADGSLSFAAEVGKKRVDFVLHCGPGDTAVPVLTLMVAGDNCPLWLGSLSHPLSRGAAHR